MMPWYSYVIVVFGLLLVLAAGFLVGYIWDDLVTALRDRRRDDLREDDDPFCC